MLALGLALALASAFATNVGFLLRHRGAVAAPDVDVRHPLRSAIDLFRSKWWTIGYLVAAVAYGLHVGALALASLSLVQAVLAGGLALLGVIAERWFGFHLGKREWTGIGLAAAGLAFLALTGGGESGQESSDYSMAAMIAWESTLVALGTTMILLHRRQRSPSRHGVLLGVAAGLLFTVTHVAVKALTGHVGEGVAAIAPYALVAVVAAIVAFFASARSLQIGDAVAVIAVTSIASNASAIPAGVVVFSDPIGDDAVSIVLRSLAFILVVLAAAIIPGPTRAT
ncbi:MAG TPA: DMT family transporter, partial [Candidatus Limnocylindria bacterium]